MIKNTDNKNLKSIRIGGNENEQGRRKIPENNGIIKGFDGLEIAEDTTKYGEFISSYFAWVGLDKQKEIVDRIENITKKR